MSANPGEPQRYFALDGTDHPSHAEQARMIRRYIAWRNRNAHNQKLRELVKRANVASAALGQHPDRVFGTHRSTVCKCAQCPADLSKLLDAELSDSLREERAAYRLQIVE